MLRRPHETSRRPPSDLLGGAALLLAALALASLTPSEAAAAEARDPAAAQALFDQARELARQGRFAEACPKFLESNRLDPGIGTQFHLAECYERSGKIATAWATFLDVASLARSSGELDREKAATKHAAQLEARLPKLTVNVPQASQTQGLEVHRDGILVGAAQWGTAVPADPGEHELTVSAPGRQTLRRTLKLEEGKVLSFDVPVLAIDGGASKEAPSPAAAELPAPAPAPLTNSDQGPQPPAAAPPAADKRSVDAWPLVLASAGVVGLAVGTGFALKANSANSKSKQDCDAADPNVCGPAGLSQRNDARTQGNVATIGFTSGGALLVVAGVVWALESRSAKHAGAARAALRANAAVAPGNAALYLQGNF